MEKVSQWRSQYAMLVAGLLRGCYFTSGNPTRFVPGSCATGAAHLPQPDPQPAFDEPNQVRYVVRATNASAAAISM